MSGAGGDCRLTPRTPPRQVFPLLRWEYGLAVFWAGVAASTAACAVWFRRAMRADTDPPDALSAPRPPRPPPPVDSDSGAGGWRGKWDSDCQ